MPRRARGARLAQLLLLLALLGGLGVAVVGLTRLDVDTRVTAFVPSNDPSVTGWTEMQQAFGGDPIVAVIQSPDDRALASPGTIDDLVALEGTLAGLTDVAVVYGPGTVLNQVAAQTQDLILELTAARDALRDDAETTARNAGQTEAEITAAGTAALTAFDTRYGALLVQALPAGLPTLRNGQFAEAVTQNEDGTIRANFAWILPDPDHGAIYIRPREGLSQDQTAAVVASVREVIGTSELYEGVVISGAPVIAAGLGDQIRDEAPRLAFLSMIAVLIAFLITNQGRWWQRILPIGIGLVASAFVLGIVGAAGIGLSVAVLAFLPTILGVGTDFPIYAQGSGRRHVLVAAIAASIGFASMAASPMPFVRQYGLLLAAGVLATTLLALAVLPAPTEDFDDNTPTEHTPAPLARSRALQMGVAVVVLVASGGWWALSNLDVETRPQTLAQGVDVLDDADRAEAILGASGELSVRLTGTDLLNPAVLDWYRDVEAQIVTQFGDRLRPIVTPQRLFGFLGDNPSATEVNAAAELVPGYLARSILATDQTSMVASFGLRLGDLEAQRELVDEVAAGLPAPPDGTEVRLDGLPVIAARAVDLLDGQQVLPSLIGIVGFAAIVLVGLRDRRAAALAAATALVSTGLGALLIAASGQDLSPLSIALGSLSVGVGGEFALVVYERLRTGHAHPIRPVITATCTSLAGFSVLAFSSLQMLREFAVVLGGSVLLAAICGTVTAWIATPRPVDSRTAA